ncbi:hypothetical protein V8D89_016163 [Ganoderma adspersum]
MTRRGTFLTATALFLRVFSRVAAVNITVPTSAPSGAQTLSPTLVSFSIEQDRWPDWVGTESPNDFTTNALLNYAELTGTPPDIRVGANSEDHTVWSPSVTINEDEFPPPNTITPFPEATHITVGDAYYQLSRFLLPGTRMTWGINFGADNVTNAVNMVKSIVKAFATSAVIESGVVLERIEIGNEADLYSNNGLRPSNYAVNAYVPDWISVAGPVAEAAGITSNTGSVTLQGASFANQGFTPREIFGLGILNSAPGKAISVISQHHYSGFFCQGGNFPLVSFLSKAAVRGNLSIFNADIAATHAQGLTYILGETNSIACHGAPGVSNTAGIALWVVDYTLQAATLGVKQAFFHEGIGFKYNFFQPISLNRSIIDGSTLNPPQAPHVQPAYYAGILINTFIGSSGAAQVVELTVNDTNVSGYAAFEGGRLARAVFVNFNSWLTTSTGTRPSVHIDFGGRTGNAMARRLVIQHADDTANVTFAGQSFETPGDPRPAGTVVSEMVVLSAGVNLRATEAVLIEFE